MLRNSRGPRRVGKAGFISLVLHNVHTYMRSCLLFSLLSLSASAALPLPHLCKQQGTLVFLYIYIYMLLSVYNVRSSEYIYIFTRMCFLLPILFVAMF